MKFKKFITGITSFLLIGNIFLVSGASVTQAVELNSMVSNNPVQETSDSNNYSDTYIESEEGVLGLQEADSFTIESSEIENTEATTNSSTTTSEDDLEFENTFKSPNPEIQAMIDSLTEEDLKNAVGEDGLGEKEHDTHEAEAYAYSNRSYENVNNYIKRNKFPNPKVTKDSRFGSTPKYNYKIGQPIGVVVHETANPNSTINGEVNFMYNNQRNAFVHAFTDRNQVIETAPTEYLAWGAGPNANPYFMHIELVQSKNFDDFARSVNNDAFWISTQLKKYNLAPTLADNNNGIGSVISHHAVSKYYGGTNHTDPTGYFAKWGYNMQQFFELIEYHYYQKTPEPKPTEKEKYEVFDRDVSIKSNASFNIHSKPYPYEGFKILGNTKDTQGKQVHVNMKSKTSVATYYSVEGMGWIDSRAFTNGLDTVTKKSFNRQGKIKANVTYNFYKEPYNTKGADKTGLTSKNFPNEDVQITQQATNNRTKEVFYLVKNQGWLPAVAFSIIYDEENIKNISKDVSIKPGSTNNVHSRPYPYYGFKVTGTTKEHNGKQVHISQEAKTSNGTYYLVDGIGWIRSNAFTTSLDTLTKKRGNPYGQIKSSTLYNFYTEPYNTKNAKRTGTTTKTFYGQNVELLEKATNNRTKENFYLIKEQGWLPEAAFSIIYDEENIKNISKDVSIKPGSTNNVHSRPYPYYGFEVTGTTKEHNGEQVHISKEAKTSNGTYYLVDDIGWIRDNALTTNLDTLTKKRGNPYGRVKSNALYNFYTEPYNTKNAKRTGTTTKEFFGQEIELIQQATNNRTKEDFYLVKDHGWIPKNAFSLVYDVENIKNISKNVTILSSSNNNIHSRPFPYYGFKIIGQTKSHRGKQVHLSEEAKTSNGIYYLADNIGWIHANAFTKNIDSVTKTTFNRDAKILNNTYYFYTEPYNTLNSERTGQTTNSLTNKDVVLTQKAVSKSKNTYYYVKNYGWVDQKALFIYDVPNYEKLNMRLQVKPNVSYNVHTEPYPYKGYRVIGNTKSRNMNGKTYNIYKMAHTSNGVYYEVAGHGWVNRNAFQKERTVGTFMGTDRNRVISLLSSHEKDRYYLGTPYRSLLWSNDPAASMSPLGAPNRYGAGMNCTGFVAHAMQQSGGNINKITQVANAWGGVANAYNWRDALKKNTDYSTFKTVNQLLSSGKAKKGDIIYFEPNYNLPGYDCHIAFFWGNNSSHNRTWHSTGPGNNISNIYSGTPFTMIYLFPMD